MYRIFWKSKITGAQGNGEPIPLHEAILWKQQADKDWPELDHWIEEEKEDPAYLEFKKILYDHHHSGRGNPETRSQSQTG